MSRRVADRDRDEERQGGRDEPADVRDEPGEQRENGQRQRQRQSQERHDDPLARGPERGDRRRAEHVTAEHVDGARARRIEQPTSVAGNRAGELLPDPPAVADEIERQEPTKQQHQDDADDIRHGARDGRQQAVADRPDQRPDPDRLGPGALGAGGRRSDELGHRADQRGQREDHDRDDRDARPHGHAHGGGRPTQAASLERGRRRRQGRCEDHGHDDRHDDRREQQRDLGHDHEQRGDDECSPAPLTQAVQPDGDESIARRGRGHGRHRRWVRGPAS